jgi:hypothetical protein
VSDTPTLDAIDARAREYRAKFADAIAPLAKAARDQDWIAYRNLRRQCVEDIDLIGVAAISLLAHETPQDETAPLLGNRIDPAPTAELPQ